LWELYGDWFVTRMNTVVGDLNDGLELKPTRTEPAQPEPEPTAGEQEMGAFSCSAAAGDSKGGT
jgi:hypothetical protein